MTVSRPIPTGPWHTDHELVISVSTFFFVVVVFCQETEPESSFVLERKTERKKGNNKGLESLYKQRAAMIIEPYELVGTLRSHLIQLPCTGPSTT